LIRQAASFIKSKAMNPIEAIYQHYIKAYKVSTDSRKIEKDAVFFALKGENFDANDFALQVAEQGVASLVVADRKDLPKHERILIVTTH
jgi:UDP-N-acetylmuramoyl-tripeptide--D-alanyl-D-alanine ligase